MHRCRNDWNSALMSKRRRRCGKHKRRSVCLWLGPVLRHLHRLYQQIKDKRNGDYKSHDVRLDCRMAYFRHQVHDNRRAYDTFIRAMVFMGQRPRIGYIPDNHILDLHHRSHSTYRLHPDCNSRSSGTRNSSILRRCDIRRSSYSQDHFRIDTCNHICNFRCGRKQYRQDYIKNQEDVSEETTNALSFEFLP